MRCRSLVALAVLAACGESAADPLLPSASDSGTDTTADTGEDVVSDTDTITDLTGTMWSGGGIQLELVAAEGFWSDGCYGGYLTGPFTVTDGAVAWPARFAGGAGAPEPRDVRADGNVTRDRLTLSIVELTGETFWGPWTLFPADEVSLEFCD